MIVNAMKNNSSNDHNDKNNHYENDDNNNYENGNNNSTDSTGLVLEIPTYSQFWRYWFIAGVLEHITEVFRMILWIGLVNSLLVSKESKY